jgi:transcriptional regulator with XRE-family HTH domain
MASTPQSRPRRRKVVVLTQTGVQKLQAAQSQSDIWDAYAKTCTLEALSERTGLSTHTLSKVHARKAGVDLRTLVRYFSAFDLTLEANDYRSAEKPDTNLKSRQNKPFSEEPTLLLGRPTTTVSWGTAPDVSRFYGRAPELATLKDWILEQRCRLITISGMGGIGKTWLSVKLLEQIQPAFKIVVWRCLRPISRGQMPLSIDEQLDDLLRHLAPQAGLFSSATTHTKILQLLDCLQKTPCLLVLDNIESILQRSSLNNSAEGCFASKCQAGHEAYFELFRLVGQGRHQSCLILTSREELYKLQALSGVNRRVRLFPLGGLQTPDIKQMFGAKGFFQGSTEEWHQLVTYYGGNPFVLEIVATAIQQFFDGDIAAFLMYEALLLDDICELMDQQFGLLSGPEKAVVGALASQGRPCSLWGLRSQIPSSISAARILEILKSLKSRSLLSKTASGTALPSFPGSYVEDYINEHFLRA